MTESMDKWRKFNDFMACLVFSFALVMAAACIVAGVAAGIMLCVMILLEFNIASLILALILICTALVFCTLWYG